MLGSPQRGLSRLETAHKVEKQTQDFFFWNADQSKKFCLREIFSVEQFSEEELRRGLEPAVAWSCRMGHLDVKDIVHCI